MTIIFAGHVENIANGQTPGGRRLTIQPEARRDLATFTLEAFKGEADAYQPGAGVEVRIIPSSLDKAFITPWEAVYSEIAALLGYKGELHNAPHVIEKLKETLHRLEALHVAIGTLKNSA